MEVFELDAKIQHLVISGEETSDGKNAPSKN